MPAWPDLVIGGITVFFAYKGYRNGFVRELAGPVALFVAIVAAFRYTGSLDGLVTSLSGLTAGSAHAVGLIVFAVLAYAFVTLVAWLLSRIAGLPGIGLVNGIAGAAIGACKALVGAWAVMYVVLFFPLPNDLRTDLHNSVLAQFVTQPDAAIDASVEGAVRTVMPWFARPFVGSFFAHHRL
jgi:uncharacterized membrane protein required for colicin V production